MKQQSRLLKLALERQAATVAAPTFQVKLEARHKAFSSNMFYLFRRKPQASLRLVSPNAVFWPDVFVAGRLPWRHFAESLIYHGLAITLLWGVAQIPPRRVHTVVPPLPCKPEVIYYEASDYLPPLNTGGSDFQRQQKGDPGWAPQTIISVPPKADNRTQTVVVPPQLKLAQDLPLPNIVAWSQPAPTVPLAATASSRRDLEMPMVAAVPIAPPPALDSALSRQNISPAQASVVEPPQQVEAAAMRRIGEVDIAHSDVVAPAPQLPVSEERTVRRAASLEETGAGVIPPPPSLQDAGERSGGRLIALNLHPAASTLVEAPARNRHGSFAAAPDGAPGASGTPETAGTKASNAAGVAGPDPGLPKGIPPGILVYTGHRDLANAGNQGDGSSSGRRLLADATPPRVSTKPSSSAIPPAENKATELERRVFGARKSYSMTLNVPNLNSGSGSWVMHFAEMEGADANGQLIAPQAMEEVDPGYPLELMRHNVQGTVTLYAVIRSDGSVGQVRVLNSVDERLDNYACAALLRWKFQPATKNGNPVALEAVVMIPFKPLRGTRSF